MSKIKNTIISVILSLCMVVASLPVELLAQESVEVDEAETVQELEEAPETEDVQSTNETEKGTKAEDETDAETEESAESSDKTQYVIISFEEFPEENTQKNVAIGTPIEDLQLPDSLTVSYISRTEKPEDGNNHEKEKTDTEGDEEPEDEAGNDSETENGEEEPEDEAENGSKTEPSDEEPGDEAGNGSETEPNEENPKNESGNGTETDTDEISQEDETENDPATENGESDSELKPETESNEPEINEPETMQETVTVHMKEYQSEPDNITATETLSVQDTEQVFENMGGETSKETTINGEPEYTETVHTITIEGIIWMSTPEYDAYIEGNYVFTPVLPEEYRLSEGVELPEIIVIVGGAEDADVLEEAAEPVMDVEPTEPACGEISTDTIWTAGTLTDGTVTVTEGATLTITGSIQINGTVTIKGEGTIVRGNTMANFYASSGGNLILSKITVDGGEDINSSSMIDVRDGTLTLCDGCTIENCNGGAISISRSTLDISGAKITNCSRPGGGGGAISMSRCIAGISGLEIKNCTAGIYGGAIHMDNSTVDIWDATITGCSAPLGGGAIDSNAGNTLKIYGGTYSNNCTTGGLDPHGLVGGGFIYNCSSDLYIYGGDFIGNVATTKGGVINHCGHYGTTTYLYGGYFEGNKCTYEEYKGSGGVFNSTVDAGKTDLYLAGDAHFVGDEEYGTDGIYLDQDEIAGISRKIWISDTFNYPVTFYLIGKEGYVIAEGWNRYAILENRDMKKIYFVNVGEDEVPWYPVLNKKTNQVILSTTPPPYMEKFFVYYISNGATGTVKDDNNNDEGYDSGAVTKVQSAAALSWENHRFVGWNTKADGTGEYYQPGDDLTITGDIDLYAIFEEIHSYTLTATFYSGYPIQEEKQSVTIWEPEESGTVKAPNLKELAGWEKIGWSEEIDKYDDEKYYAEREQITLTENKSFYGAYKKDVTLSYKTKLAVEVPDPETKTCYAKVHEEIGYQQAEFKIAPEIKLTGHTFLGWNTQENGGGDTYQPGEEIKITNDIILYPVFVTAAYTVEHYLQNLNGEGYTRADIYTQELRGIVGETVTADSISFVGFTENPNYSDAIRSGDIEEDVNLVLKLYYNRNIYKVNFDLNYENSDNSAAPSMQTVLYGNKLNEVAAPSRRGYSFKGWYTVSETTGNIWDFSDNVENITEYDDVPEDDFTGENNEEQTTVKKYSATLYAKWVDDIEPVLGDTSYNSGYKDLKNWIIRKKDLIITVPITEEGSGVDKVEYTMTPSNGDAASGGSANIESVYSPRQIRTNSVVELAVENSQTVAKITISEDYEGVVSLECTDKAGNSSGDKMLTVTDGGIIVEDNAPQIDVTVQDEKDRKRVVDVAVSDLLVIDKPASDDDDTYPDPAQDTENAETNYHIAGGIANISYQVDDNASQTVKEEDYTSTKYADGNKSGILLSCKFNLDITGSGEHTLKITAIDNAGNESSKTTTVSLKKPAGKKTAAAEPQITYTEEPTEVFTPFVRLANPQPRKDKEPKTGDTSVQVEVYATMAMIAGMFYILLYFTTGKNGMTEDEKNEFVSRILAWAKRGSRIRKPIAIAAVFWVLFYYHSIGKRVQIEWNEVYGR